MSIKKLKYWTHAILPLVYDDSLSYLEILAKVTAKVNELIDFISNNLTDKMRELLNDAFVDAAYNAETETITIYFDPGE